MLKFLKRLFTPHVVGYENPVPGEKTGQLQKPRAETWSFEAILANTKRDVLDFGFVRFFIPAGYARIDEGIPLSAESSIGFAKGLFNAVGVLRLTPVTLSSEEEADMIFRQSASKQGGGEPITLNGFPCLFSKEVKNYGSNDYLFWKEEVGQMHMYFYQLHLKHSIFIFSYRVPISIEKSEDGIKERKEIEKILNEFEWIGGEGK
jgi:hypothetical protein